MVDLRSLEKQFLASHIKEGGRVCDFTMGNGHDTLYLSRAVGPQGRVYAFDVQESALASTRKTLAEGGAYDNYELILDSHANVAKYVKERICAGVFNLGYLPGSDKRVTTMVDSTLKAVRGAIDLLEDDGIVLVCVYPGHAEGAAEGEALCAWLSEAYDRKEYCVGMFRILNSPDSPFFIAVEKR